MRKILLGLAILVTTLPVMADDLGMSLQNGYKIVGRSTINDSFMGCEWNKTFPLANGQYFMCEETKNNLPEPNLNPDFYVDIRKINQAALNNATLASYYGISPQIQSQQALKQQQIQQAIQIYNQQKANSYNLPIIILQNQYGTTKYIINGTEYRGKLF